MRFETIIIGAGAAGMMCAAHVRDALVLDHAKAAGEKIRISGGGRCNFTNIYASAENFLSENTHFAKSALARYTQWDFIDLVQRYDIPYHEKTLGQLFCDTSAKDIIAMLRHLMKAAGAELWLKTSVTSVRNENGIFTLDILKGECTETLTCKNLVLATGGKSIPKMGATGFAYDVATQFGMRVTETRPALVPFTFSDGRFAEISGVSLPVRAQAGAGVFDEAMLFTHRGLSGPAILQISSYWAEGADITLNLTPDGTTMTALRDQRQISGRRNFKTELATHLPARLVDHLAQDLDLTGNLADWSDARLSTLFDKLQNWSLRPSGSEGYRTAEVTFGGIATEEVSSKSMMSKRVQGLYIVGEAMDVTGWLGGYNFQWAWSSGMAAARDIMAV